MMPASLGATAMRPAFVVALATLVLVPLAGCDRAKDKTVTTASAEPALATLTAAIGGAAGLSTTAAALKSTGLSTVFEGAAPYTVLAPEDDAFGALGETGTMLKAPENGAAMAAVLKAHILPGYLTVADIDAALKAAQGKPVTMTTMTGSAVSFARTGEGVTVTAADGSRAKISGVALTAGNGVVIPIDAVLKKIPATT